MSPRRAVTQRVVWFVAAAACLTSGCDDNLREVGGDVSAADEDTSFEWSLDARDGAADGIRPSLLDASLWSATQLAEAVAQCEAWHAEMAQPPSADRVADCAGERCTLDVVIEPGRYVPLTVELTWADEPLAETSGATPYSYCDGSAGQILVAGPPSGDVFADAEARRDERVFAFELPTRPWDVSARVCLQYEGGVLRGTHVVAEGVDPAVTSVLRADLGPLDVATLEVEVEVDGEAPTTEDAWYVGLTPAGSKPDWLGRRPELSWRVEVRRPQLYTFEGTYDVYLGQGGRDGPPGYRRIASAVQLHAGQVTSLAAIASTVRLTGSMSLPDLESTIDEVTMILRSEQDGTDDGGHVSRTIREPWTDYELHLWAGPWTLDAELQTREGRVWREQRQRVFEAFPVFEDTTRDIELRAASVRGELGPHDGDLSTRRVVASSSEPGLGGEFYRHPIGESDPGSSGGSSHGTFDFDVAPGRWRFSTFWSGDCGATWGGEMTLARLDVRSNVDLGQRQLGPLAPFAVEIARPPRVRAGGDIGWGQWRTRLEAPWRGRRWTEFHRLEQAPDPCNAGKVEVGVYDVWLRSVFSGSLARHEGALWPIEHCTPLTGVQAPRLDPDWRTLRVTVRDLEGVPLPQIEVVVESLDPEAELIAGRANHHVVRRSAGDATHVELDVVPGTYKVRASLAGAREELGWRTTDTIVEVP